MTAASLAPPRLNSVPPSPDEIAALERTWRDPPGVAGWLSAINHKAIGRRFIVTNIDHARPATLRIYGSLAAGTLTATEPRYATKIEYDDRFERVRPPGFPSTNRYEAAAWDGQWTAAPGPSLDDAP